MYKYNCPVRGQWRDDGGGEIFFILIAQCTTTMRAHKYHNRNSLSIARRAACRRGNVNERTSETKNLHKHTTHIHSTYIQSIHLTMRLHAIRALNVCMTSSCTIYKNENKSKCAARRGYVPPAGRQQTRRTARPQKLVPPHTHTHTKHV